MAKRLANGVWVDEPDVQTTGTQTSDTQSGTDWLGKMNELMDKYNNRDPFKFDLDKNALYQNYKNQYVLQGQKAMADTMGQAAALTGGYANSYAQNVGQQAYGDYLTKLNAVVPELYAQARSEYDKQGDDLLNQLSLAKQMYGLAYDRDRDALADQRYQDELAYARERDALEDQRYQDELAYTRQQSSQSDARSYATYLLQMGIMPSADQLAAAGISPEQAAQIKNYYNLSMTGGGSGGSRGGGSRGGSSRGGGGGGSGASVYDTLQKGADIVRGGVNTVFDAFGGGNRQKQSGGGGGGGESYDELRTWLIQDMNKAWTASSAAAWNERLNNARGKTISEEQYTELKRLLANEIGAYNL